MRIHGPDQSNFNPYKNQLQKQMDSAKGTEKKDQLEISDQAKTMLENDKTNSKRAAHVQNIRDAVDKGDYQINYGMTAQNMIDFWSNQGGR